MKNLLSRCLRLAAAAAIVAAVGCTEEAVGPGAAPQVMNAAAPAGPLALEGEHAGAQYGLFLPAEWNGDLVIFIRGYDSGPAPSAPTYMAGLRDALLARGYAFAWTSNSESRFAADDAVIHARQLQALFSSRIARPAHTYAFGQSFGSPIAVRLTQASAGRKFDGAVLTCGPIGGLPRQLDFYHSALVLFRYYYPDVAVGTPVQPLDAPAPVIMGAVASDLDAAAQIAAVLQMPYTSTAELVQAVTYPVMFATATWFTGDVLLRTGGLPFFDNSGVIYAGSSDDAALNAGVERFTASPIALELVAHWYEPDGRLRSPVLTLHTARDAVVPLWHETVFAERAAAAGASGLLLQRTYDRLDHCAFTAAELVQAVEDLAGWVRTGVRPAS